MALSTFESGNLDQFNALLAQRLPAGVPRPDVGPRDALRRLPGGAGPADRVVDRDRGGRRPRPTPPRPRAQAAADEAARAAQDARARKRDAEKRIDEAQRLLDRLSPQERRERNGPDDRPRPSGPITGSGAGVQALRRGQEELGKPYRYGAEGPSAFDCSGLTLWAFQQVGVTLPRSSSQQARVGTPVPRDELRPGDLLFFYQPVSHVGIYAGDGKMINAPQTGDVVKYRTSPSRPFTGARRL